MRGAGRGYQAEAAREVSGIDPKYFDAVDGQGIGDEFGLGVVPFSDQQDHAVPGVHS
jgi:hypothetical protein